MNPLHLLVLGIVIGSNNLAAALALGALGQAAKRWRIIAIFASFEFIIPLVGISLGRRASMLIEKNLGWLPALLLLAIGAWMIWCGARREADPKRYADRVTTWRGLIVLAALLSIDNLLIGFSLGLGGTEPLVLAGVICICSTIFTWLGLQIGRTARRNWERTAEIAGGVLLIALAVAKFTGVL